METPNQTQKPAESVDFDPSLNSSDAGEFDVTNRNDVGFSVSKPNEGEPNTDDPGVVAPEEQQGAKPASDEVAPTSAPSNSPVSMTAETIQEIIKGITKSQAESAPVQPQKPLSVEERNKLLNVYQPTEQDISDILEGGESALAALSRIRDGLTTQAFTMARYFTQLQLKQFRDEVSPYIQLAQQAQREQDDAKFYRANPDLEPHRDLVNAVFNQLLNEVKSGKRQAFKTNSEAEAVLVKTVTDLLKKSGVELKPTEQNQNSNSQSKAPGKTPAGQPPKMTPQPRGGQRGATPKPKQPETASAGMDVFSDLTP